MPRGQSHALGKYSLDEPVYTGRTEYEPGEAVQEPEEGSSTTSEGSSEDVELSAQSKPQTAIPSASKPLRTGANKTAERKESLPTGSKASTGADAKADASAAKTDAAAAPASASAPLGSASKAKSEALQNGSKKKGAAAASSLRTGSSKGGSKNAAASDYDGAAMLIPTGSKFQGGRVSIFPRHEVGRELHPNSIHDQVTRTIMTGVGHKSGLSNVGFHIWTEQVNISAKINPNKLLRQYGGTWTPVVEMLLPPGAWPTFRDVMQLCADSSMSYDEWKGRYGREFGAMDVYEKNLTAKHMYEEHVGRHGEKIPISRASVQDIHIISAGIARGDIVGAPFPVGVLFTDMEARVASNEVDQNVAFVIDSKADFDFASTYVAAKPLKCTPQEHGNMATMIPQVEVEESRKHPLGLNQVKQVAFYQLTPPLRAWVDSERKNGVTTAQLMENGIDYSKTNGVSASEEGLQYILRTIESCQNGMRLTPVKDLKVMFVPMNKTGWMGVVEDMQAASIPVDTTFDVSMRLDVRAIFPRLAADMFPPA